MDALERRGRGIGRPRARRPRRRRPARDRAGPPGVRRRRHAALDGHRGARQRSLRPALARRRPRPRRPARGGGRKHGLSGRRDPLLVQRHLRRLRRDRQLRRRSLPRDRDDVRGNGAPAGAHRRGEVDRQHHVAVRRRRSADRRRLRRRRPAGDRHRVPGELRGDRHRRHRALVGPDAGRKLQSHRLDRLRFRRRRKPRGRLPRRAAPLGLPGPGRQRPLVDADEFVHVPGEPGRGRRGRRRRRRDRGVRGDVLLCTRFGHLRLWRRKRHRLGGRALDLEPAHVPRHQRRGRRAHPDPRGQQLGVVQLVPPAEGDVGLRARPSRSRPLLRPSGEGSERGRRQRPHRQRR